VGAGASELVNPEEEEEEKSVSQPVREGRGMGRRWSEVAHSALVSPSLQVKYGGRTPKFIWAPCHVMYTALLIG
jgi:hypothetical protein